jgi:hypothetical protein
MVHEKLQPIGYTSEVATGDMKLVYMDRTPTRRSEDNLQTEHTESPFRLDSIWY